VRPVGLRTPRLVLDEPVLGDADLVTRYCQDPLFEQYLTTPWPYTRAHAETFLGVHVPESWATGAELTWAIRTMAGGPLLGVVSVRDGEHELGYWLGADHRGSGYMSEAVIAVTEWALGGGIRRATSLRWRAVEGNVASAKVARAAGFRLIDAEHPTVPTRDGGTLPAWHAVRTSPTDPAAFASWATILGAAV
jgi:RimJ/RimL family protein N-acetyltransferase